MKNQRRHRDDRICDKNRAVHDIIPLTEDNYYSHPTGAPVSDDDSSVDYSFRYPPKGPEGDFVSGDFDYGPSNSPSPASNIS